jgi:DNA mismatch repair protein MutL
VIERPASVVKELVENSLDAGATAIKIFLNDGGKTLISVEDDGAGIELTDMDFLFERYTTSKIYGEQDLLKLKSYGFRGEALAAISQVSKVTIVSKTAYSEMASKLVKLGQSLTMNHLPAGFERGTIVTIENLFHDAPTKLTSLKSSQTEFFYCYNYFVDVALYHYDISFALYKNDKPVLVLPKVDSLLERIVQVHKKDRSQHLQHIQTANPELHLTGLVSDSALTF